MRVIFYLKPIFFIWIFKKFPFRKNEKKLINVIDYEWNKRDSSLPYKSKYEALVIASLIESEASLDQERKLIASVFVNRLRKK